MSSSSDLVVVTCASGKQATYLLPQFDDSTTLRLVVHSEASLASLTARFPKASVVIADLAEPGDCKRIVSGATTVFHVGPTYHPRETEIGYNMIDAAELEAEKGILKHFILSSVLNPQLRKMLNHDCKRYEEEYLMESALNWTIIQPSHIMDMFPIAALAEQSEPVYTANWDPDVRFSFMSLRDLGDAAFKVITERERHYFAQYPLASTRPMSYTEITAVASRVLRKPIEIRQRSYMEAVEALLNIVTKGTAAHPRTRDAAERMLLFYNRRGLVGNPNVLEWLLGRTATTHEKHFNSKLSEKGT